MTTTTDTALPPVDASVVTISPRPAYAGELARAAEAERAARASVVELEARVAELEGANRRLRTEQITDGSDARLVAFWGRAEEAANDAEFCPEYDKIAGALGGPRRARDYSVRVDARVNVRLYVTVQARSDEEAESNVGDEIDRDAILTAIRENGYDEIDIYQTQATED